MRLWPKRQISQEESQAADWTSLGTRILRAASIAKAIHLVEKAEAACDRQSRSPRRYELKGVRGKQSYLSF